MKKRMNRLVNVSVIVLFFIAVPQCNATSGTTNPVHAIDLPTLETIVGQENFDGIVIAMASWCPPCRKELPVMAEIYQDYQEQGLNIIAISIDAEGPAAVQPLIDELKIPFPVYWVGKTAVQYYKIVGIPTLLIYQKGKLREKLPGSQSRQVVEGKIRTLLKPPINH